MPRRLVDTRFWTDPKVRLLQRDARLLFLYLLTAPIGHLSGIFYAYHHVLADHTGLSETEVRDALAALTQVGLIERDEPMDLVWVVNMLAYQGAGWKIEKSVLEHVDGLHQSPIVSRFRQKYLSAENSPRPNPPHTPPQNQDQYQGVVSVSGSGGHRDTPSAYPIAIPHRDTPSEKKDHTHTPKSLEEEKKEKKPETDVSFYERLAGVSDDTPSRYPIGIPHRDTPSTGPRPVPTAPELLERWCHLFDVRAGGRPIAGPKEATIIEDLCTQHGGVLVARALEEFMSGEDDFVRNAGYPLGLLAKQFPQFLARSAPKPQERQGQPPGPRWEPPTHRPLTPEEQVKLVALQNGQPVPPEAPPADLDTIQTALAAFRRIGSGGAPPEPLPQPFPGRGLTSAESQVPPAAAPIPRAPTPDVPGETPEVRRDRFQRLLREAEAASAPKPEPPA